MLEFTFYKDNKLSGEHKKTAPEIIYEFNKTEESKLDAPFERLILNFMMNNYGSFDSISDSHWCELIKARKSDKI